MQKITENELFLPVVYGNETHASPFHLLGTRTYGIDLLCKWRSANPELFKKIPASFVYEYADNLSISVLDCLAKVFPQFLKKLLLEHPSLAQEIPAQAWLAKNDSYGTSPVSSVIANKCESIFKLLPPEVQDTISEFQNKVGTNLASFFASSPKLTAIQEETAEFEPREISLESS